MCLNASCEPVLLSSAPSQRAPRSGRALFDPVRDKSLRMGRAGDGGVGVLQLLEGAAMTASCCSGLEKNISNWS